MRTVRALVAQAGRIGSAGLRACDEDPLAGYVADPAHPWWRRWACAVAPAAGPPVAPDEDEQLRRAVSAAASPWTSPPCSSTGRTRVSRPDQAPVHRGSRPLWASACSKTDADAGNATSSAKPSYCR